MKYCPYVKVFLKILNFWDSVSLVNFLFVKLNLRILIGNYTNHETYYIFASEVRDLLQISMLIIDELINLLY